MSCRYSRRDFLAGIAITAAASALPTGLVPSPAWGERSSPFRVAVINNGNRTVQFGAKIIF